MPSLQEDTLEASMYGSNIRILTNIAIVVSIMLLICYAVPYVYSTAVDNMENYTQNDKSNSKNSWDIVNEVHAIRERQKHNIRKMSQVSSYGI